jgi:hypothetical protein
MLLNIRIVIAHLPEDWISQSRYDDLTNVTTVVIDDRRIPEGRTLQFIIAHEISHALAAHQHRERLSAAQERYAANAAHDYVINEMLRPRVNHVPHVHLRMHTPDGKRIIVSEARCNCGAMRGDEHLPACPHLFP